MAENALQTLQQLVQDVISPDVRELKVRHPSPEKQMDTRFDAMDSGFKATDRQNEAQLKALLSAISESKVQTELSSMRVMAALSERLAVLEAQRHQPSLSLKKQKPRICPGLLSG